MAGTGGRWTGVEASKGGDATASSVEEAASAKETASEER